MAKELALHNISTLSIDHGSREGGVKELQKALDAFVFMRQRQADPLDVLEVFSWS